MWAEDVDSEAWIRRFHDGPDGRGRLVCLPFAGGAASYFHPFSALLAPDVEVLAVQYPGRQDRRSEPVLTDLEAIADHVFTALRPWAGEPLAFFGHSMGAVVAYEVVRRIEREGLPAPVALFVSGRRAPSLRRADKPVHELDDRGVVAELLALGGTAPGVLADEEMLPLILPALRGDYQAITEYRCREQGAVLDVPVTALVGDSDPRVDVDEAKAWQAHTTADFRLEVFPGGHFYLNDRVAEVAALVRDRIAPRG
ncbi:thioesterase II family protein [Streptomyces spongiae]|uniref:Thioesterase n=1 Tax=Streptomyces spongiae TaxID=565072 RepID=A0A5N8XJM2_9ACTN|nr:alpha/beta fold hydrolase [Streptomyces spongiae]MPY59660.1 thioesterase [Streptomyces spongiae]